MGDGKQKAPWAPTQRAEIERDDGVEHLGSCVHTGWGGWGQLVVGERNSWEKERNNRSDMKRCLIKLCIKKSPYHRRHFEC